MSTTSVEPREPRPATAGEFVIHTESLTKVYPGSTPIKAVDSLDLSIHPGEIFGLLGPNGAGKTTTVGMLTTRIVPTGGRAFVGGVAHDRNSFVRASQNPSRSRSASS